jgi:TonB family protein
MQQNLIQKSLLSLLHATANGSLLLLLVIVAGNQVHAADALVPIAGPAPAIPTTVVAPTFPADAVAPKEGVRVDVVGMVHLDGHFEPKSVTVSAGFDHFAQAVSDVLQWWRFVPAIDSRECRARSEQFSMAIWFEGSTKDPHIFLALPKRENGTPKTGFEPLVESFFSPEMDYPHEVGRLEGEVQVLLLFTGSGQVTSVSVLSSTPYGAFDSAVLSNARQTTVRWKEPQPIAPICASRTYRFCSEGAGRQRAPFTGCK